jgi:hypothetical protein
MFFDHVNNILEHQDPKYPGVPLHYVPEITWNFNGTEKRKRDKSVKNIVLCPYLDFMYCDNPHCQTCASNPDKSVSDARKPMVIVSTQLEEIKKPVSFNERPLPERREIQDRIGSAILEYKSEMSSGAVGKLLAIADELGRREMWVYWMLTREERKTINVTLLHEICRQRGYKPGWAWWKAKEIRGRKRTDREYDEVTG